jgi:hypothetical protein
MLKNFMSLEGVKTLSKKEKVNCHGGEIVPVSIAIYCGVYAAGMANQDTDNGTLYDEITWQTIYNEHYSECFYSRF